MSWKEGRKPVVNLGRLASVLCVLVLSACASPELPEMPTISFDDTERFDLEARRNIEVVEMYRPPLSRPNVEHLYRLAPSQIARAWVRDRLRLSGSGGQVKVTIVDASVVEQQLPERTGFMSFFTDDPDRKLVARLEVRIDYEGDNGKVASASAVATAARTIMEGASINEAEEIYFKMLQDLARELDRTLSAQIYQHFTPIYRRPA